MLEQKLYPPAFRSIQKESLTPGNDRDLKNTFGFFFKKSQDHFNPYYVIAVIERNPSDQILNAYDVDYLRMHPELFSTQDRVHFYAYECFNFEEFKEGKTPTTIPIETAQLKPFAIESYFDAKYLDTWKKSQILVGSIFSNISTDTIKKAQWNVAFAYDKGHKEEEGIKWAWCATQPTTNPGTMQAVAMIGFYYFKLAQNSDIPNQLIAHSKKWFQIAASNGDQNSKEMLLLIKDQYKTSGPKT